MDFFSRLTSVLVEWGVLCLVMALFVGIESDCYSTPWAKKWWPRLLKIGVGFFVLASLCFIFNF